MYLCIEDIFFFLEKVDIRQVGKQNKEASRKKKTYCPTAKHLDQRRVSKDTSKSRSKKKY
jgi:hypothetical protein